MRDKSPSLVKFFTLVQGAEPDPGFIDTLFTRSTSVRLLEPGDLKEDYPITTFFGKQKILKVFCKRTNKHEEF